MFILQLFHVIHFSWPPISILSISIISHHDENQPLNFLNTKSFLSQDKQYTTSSNFITCGSLSADYKISIEKNHSISTQTKIHSEP